MVISMLKIRRPLGRRIFNMGIAIPGKTVFLIETAPRSFEHESYFLACLYHWIKFHGGAMQQYLYSRYYCLESHIFSWCRSHQRLCRTFCWSFCVCAQSMRWLYNATSSLIGWEHTQNDPWTYLKNMALLNSIASNCWYKCCIISVKKIKA